MTPAQKAKKTRADKKATEAAIAAHDPETYAKAADFFDAAAAVCEVIGDTVGAGARRANARDFRVKAGKIEQRPLVKTSTEFDY